MFPKDLIERIKLPFKKNKKLYSSLYKILGFYPIRIKYYEQALLHKSSSIKKEGNWVNNERLEFLGDAILDAVVGDIVFRHFKGKKEGFLTNTRSKIVQRETLNKLAVEIGLDKLIISSSHSSSHNSYMCGNAFEALVGAIYLDRGYGCCKKFIEKRILSRLINLDKVAYKEVNFKSKLIEWAQKNHVTITFDLLEQTTEGSSTPVFVSQVLLEDVVCCKGKGYSKKESQQGAAKETLSALKTNSKLLHEILERRDNRNRNDLPELSRLPVDMTEQIQQESEKTDVSVNTVETQGEFDLSDISIRLRNKTKEEIVSAAETAAFQEESTSYSSKKTV